MSAWSSKCRTFKFSGSFPSGTPRKTSNEAIRSDPKERKVSKGLAKYRNAWTSFIKKPCNPYRPRKHVKMNMMMIMKIIRMFSVNDKISTPCQLIAPVN